MARKTKASVYAKYGIEFKNDKIRSPFGTWIPELLTYGTNSKVGDAATSSIYHGNETLKIADFGERTQSVMNDANVTEINGSCECHCEHCYCDNGFYKCDSTKAANMLKLILARMYPDFFENAIKAQIEYYGYTQVRIHACGDFFNETYVNVWKRIVLAFPETVFWTYTKVGFALAALQGIPNLKVVPSRTPYGFNFGTCAELLYRYRKLTEDGYKVHICACGTDFEKHCSECNTGCKAIGETVDFVLFIMHSTPEYDATKDPLFPEVVAIIANQDNE